jgi:hypothetical protein
LKQGVEPVDIPILLRFRRHNEAVVTRDHSIDPAAKLDACVQTSRLMPFEGLIAGTPKFPRKFPRLNRGEARFPQRLRTPLIPPDAFKH